MRVCFGCFELDDERFVLERDRIALRVRPKVFDLLVLLVSTRDRVLLREELVLALWGTTAVGHGSLSGLVNELRQVLGERGRGPSSIRTVHGRGYQFVAPATRLDEPRVEPQSALVRRLGGVASAAAVAENLTRQDEIDRRLRSALTRVASEGARAVLVEPDSPTHGPAILDSAGRLAEAVGFATLRVDATSTEAPSSTFLVDRLSDAATRLDTTSNGVRTTRRDGSRPRSRPRDPIAARQVDERSWRITSDQIRMLARRRPIALLVERVDWGAPAETPPIDALIRLLGETRVLLIGTAGSAAFVDGARFEAEAGSRIECVRLHRSKEGRSKEDGSKEGPSRESGSKEAPSKAESGAEARDGPSSTRTSRELMEHTNVEPPCLPPTLAEALVEHVQEAGLDPESVADWLRNACAPGAREGAPIRRAEGRRRLRRVEPDTQLRQRSSGSD